jgi:hypothetical protein
MDPLKGSTFQSQVERYLSALSQPVGDRSISAWSWEVGSSPEARSTPAELDDNSVSWLDLPTLGGLDLTQQEAGLDSILGELEGSPVAIDRTALRELLIPDDGQAKADDLRNESSSIANIRKLLTFRVHFLDSSRDDRTHDEIEGPGIGRWRRVGRVFLDPIEIGVGDGWLITCRHPSAEFARAARKGMTDLDKCLPLVGSGEFGSEWEMTEKTWREGVGDSASDLAALFLSQLALGYENGIRRLRTWEETWELELLGLPGQKGADGDSIDGYQEQLANLWFYAYGLRNWLETLRTAAERRSGGPVPSWLPEADSELNELTASRVDSALYSLASQSAEIRSGNQVLDSVRDRCEARAEEARHRDAEERHRELEYIAVLFLVPTLVASVFGSNTWVPGQGTVWGFLLVWSVMVLMTAIALVFVNQRYRKGRGRSSRDR